MDYEQAKRELEEAVEELNKLKGKPKKEPPYCSFCDRGKNEYLNLIEGKKASKICDRCIFECTDLLKKEYE